MFSLRKHIPNTLTCLNLVSGCIATRFALQGQFAWAFSFIILGAVFDFFDGFAARLLKVSSPVGKELDSLADDITFGFAPAAIVFTLLKNVEMPFSDERLLMLVPYAAFLIAAFSALRLAKFNLDERQTSSFIGLPTPANALFWGALAVGFGPQIIHGEYSFYALLVGILVSSWLLVAEIPMFALKFKNFGWADNKIRYSFIALSAILLFFLKLTGFSAIVVLYIIISLFTSKKTA